MQKFETVTSRAVILDRPNIDTDVILPAKYLKTVTRAGLGVAAFEAIRAEPGNPFETLRDTAPAVLIAGQNFGCGSSREHAVWAIVDLGIRVVIAPSFSDIFAGNAVKNGLLTITLRKEKLNALIQLAKMETLRVDLEKGQITSGLSGEVIQFDVEHSVRHNLLLGIDEISQSLEFETDITAFERNRDANGSWSMEALA